MPHSTPSDHEKRYSTKRDLEKTLKIMFKLELFLLIHTGSLREGVIALAREIFVYERSIRILGH